MEKAVRSRASFKLPASVYRYRYWLALLVVVGLWALLRSGTATASFPETWNFHLRQPLDQFRSWVIGHRNTHWLFLWFFDPLSSGIDWSIRRIEDTLLWLPWPLTLFGAALLGHKLGGWKLALISGLSLFLMGMMNLWSESLQTLALMVVAVLISLTLGIPLGIWAARSDRMDAMLRPLLDAMQTMPAFVYLIPVLLFFGIARVPSVIATVIYALPPVIRLTNLGIRQVSKATIEAARSFGATSRQILFDVQIPLAIPTIMAGVNQTIMMALGIVVIAALIGAGGLGREVLVGLQRLQVGKAFQAGFAIVLMAVMLDRLSYALTKADVAQRRSRNYEQDDWAWLKQKFPPLLRRHAYLILTVLLVLTTLFWQFYVNDLRSFPAALQVSIAPPVDAGVRWMRDHLYEFGNSGLGTGAFSDFLTISILSPLRDLFTTDLPWPVVTLLLALIAASASGWKLGVFTIVGMMSMGFLGMWNESMDTLSQVIVAVLLSIMIAIPVGILAAKSDRFEMLLRPMLDFLQTIPPFVYLVPVIMLFNIGRVPGVIASVLYALPPGIRLTNLGIRRVKKETLEAAIAFGTTPWQMLTKVELPLALPSIMMGINQTVMMVLAMVIIAGLVGGGGLGLEAVIGLAKNQTGRGFEAGLAIVIMAMILDRMTQGWAQQWQYEERT
ncbi:MAG: ABC transporter permease subunit [Chloroflexi bacterium]|nr:ABC transporter permease subunit [Chloroflexota bacterium]